MCQIFYFLNFFRKLYFSMYFCFGVVFPIFPGATFSKYSSYFSRVLSIVTFCLYSEPEIMRHCRSGIAASIYSGIAASIYSGIAASMHSHSGIAASMQRHCRHAACTHSGIAASMRSQRQCRQHALVAALPPASTHTAQSELMLPFRLFQRLLSL